MKILFLVIVALFFVITPAYAQSFSDATGLVNRLDVRTGGHSFEIQSTANFDIPNFEFDKDDKKLTLFINSGLDNNLGELHIPRNLLDGDLTFYLNDVEYFPKFHTNEKISFVTLNFTGTGDNKLEIIGTVYLSGVSVVYNDLPDVENPSIREYEYNMIYIVIVMVVLIGGVSAIIFFLRKRK